MNSPSDHPEISTNDLIEKKGVMFKKYSRTPFTGCSVDYHYNGQFTIKENYKEGILEDGLREWYHDNGQLKEKGNFKDGIPDGPSETYNDNGQLCVKQNFKDGIPDGR